MVEHTQSNSQSTSEIDLPPRFPLREDLEIHLRSDGADHAVLEDQQNGKFYRLGLSEVGFIRELMKTENAETAWQNSKSSDAKFDPLNRVRAEKLCKWLFLSGLTKLSAAIQPREQVAEQSRQSWANWLAKPYFCRIKLCNPDRWLEGLVSKTGWAFSWQAGIVSVAVLLIGALAINGRWSQFIDSYDNLFTSGRWLWLLAGWCVLKIVHEMAHGATCKHYGGTVPNAGVAFVLFMPIAFIDVTSCWRFPSRWQRLHVTLAGILAEFFIAGIALLCWSYTDSVVVQQAAADVVLMATLSSLLFNLNPLLKFDGYFVIADATGIDNLYDYGIAYARYFGSRYILGLSPAYPIMPKKGWIKVYGVAAALWRAFTLLSLMVAATAIFHGAGIAVAAAGFVVFVIRPLVKLGHDLMVRSRSGEIVAWRLGTRLAGVAGLVFAVLFLFPTSLRRTTPGVVEYDPPSVLRAPTNGFVAQVHVSDGQLVQVNQPILTMHSDELSLELSTKRKELLQAEQAVRSARWHSDSSKTREAETEVVALTQQLVELESQWEQLTIRAPSNGKIVSRRMKVLEGVYLEQGAEIGAVGVESNKRLKLSLSQWEANRSDEWESSALTICIQGFWSWTGYLSHLETRASEQIPDLSLAATGGGNLTIRHREEEEPILAEPRVNAYISLAPDRSQQLRCGQRCYVRLPCWRQSLGGWLWLTIRELGHSRAA